MFIQSGNQRAVSVIRSFDRQNTSFHLFFQIFLIIFRYMVLISGSLDGLVNSFSDNINARVCHLLLLVFDKFFNGMSS